MSANVVISDLSSLQLIMSFQHAFPSILSVQKVPLHRQFHSLPDLHDSPCLPGVNVYSGVSLGESLQYSGSLFLTEKMSVLSPCRWCAYSSGLQSFPSSTIPGLKIEALISSSWSPLWLRASSLFFVQA